MSEQWYKCEDGCDGFECKIRLQDRLPFHELGVLGHGRFGLVKKVKSARTGEVLGLEEIRFNFNQEKLKRIKEKIYTHRRLRHKHITTVRGSYIKGNTACGILIEPVADCDLGLYLDRVSEKQASKQSTVEDLHLLMDAFGCLSSGLAYLHKQRIKHKDIKPANVLVHKGSVLLTDFGLSKDFSDSGASTSYGPTGYSLEWAAPEVLRDDLSRNTSADIFSLGCVFIDIFSVLAGRSPAEFRQHRQEDLTASSGSNVEYKVSWVKDISLFLHDHQRELLWTCESMISKDPLSRPSAITIWNIASVTPRNGDANTTTFCGSCCLNSYDPGQGDMREDARRIRSLAALLRQEKKLREEVERIKANALLEDSDRGCKGALPITFRDSVGRKFVFPWERVRTWQGIERLIKEAFLRVDVVDRHVHEGHYDLIGPEEEIILPQVWETIVEPGWHIKMQMWPIGELLQPSTPPQPLASLIDQQSGILLDKRDTLKRRTARMILGANTYRQQGVQGEIDPGSRVSDNETTKIRIPSIRNRVGFNNAGHEGDQPDVQDTDFEFLDTNTEPHVGVSNNRAISAKDQERGKEEEETVSPKITQELPLPRYTTGKQRTEISKANSTLSAAKPPTPVNRAPSMRSKRSWPTSAVRHQRSWPIPEDRRRAEKKAESSAKERPREFSLMDAFLPREAFRR